MIIVSSPLPGCVTHVPNPASVLAAMIASPSKQALLSTRMVPPRHGAANASAIEPASRVIGKRFACMIRPLELSGAGSGLLELRHHRRQRSARFVAEPAAHEIVGVLRARRIECSGQIGARDRACAAHR